MKAVLLCGSPRKGGNTETLLGRCIEKFEKKNIESVLVRCSEITVKPCMGCGACRSGNGECAITDDDFTKVYDLICSAEIIVCGSPVYFGSATPNLMAVLDRVGYVSRSNGNPLAHKIGGPVTVARRAGQNFTYAQLLYWYMINDMVVPGSSYWNVAFGRNIGEVSNDEEGLATIDHFADNLMWLAEKLF